MRITNKVLSNNMLRNMFQTMGGMDKYQNMATTGRKINRPSDNPSGNITTLRMRTKLAQNEQFKDNATTAKSWLEKSEDSLISMGDIMQRVRELAVKGSNSTNDQKALNAIADESDQLLEELEVLANSQNSDRYIFGGTNTSNVIYDLKKNIWTGNDNIMQVEIGEGITVDMNMNGKKIFGIDDMPGNPNSVFSALKNFSTNLRTGNFDEIGLDVAVIDSHINTILSARSEIGAKSNRIDMTMSRLDAAELSYSKVLSDTEDADMAEVIIRLKEQENVYNATLAAGARIIQPTLVDFLR